METTLRGRAEQPGPVHNAVTEIPTPKLPASDGSVSFTLTRSSVALVPEMRTAASRLRSTVLVRNVSCAGPSGSHCGGTHGLISSA